MIWLGVGFLGGRAFCPPTRRQARGSADRHVQDRALRRAGGQNALPPKGSPMRRRTQAMFPARQRLGALGGVGTPKVVRLTRRVLITLPLRGNRPIAHVANAATPAQNAPCWPVRKIRSAAELIGVSPSR